MWYNGSMNTDTLLVISAGATFLLAIAAFWAILQNYRFRKEDKDFRLKTAALDDIHQWLIDILNATTLYLTAVRDKDEKQKFIASSQCNTVLIRGGDTLVAAGLFGDDLFDKVEQVSEFSQAYHDALDKATPDQKNIEDKIVENFTTALSGAFFTLGKKKLELLPEYFPK